MLRAQEDRIVSLRAQFASTTTFAGTERSADGVLIVQKPDRFRLRLFLPLGLALFDYLSVGERTWVTAPRSPQRSGESQPDAAPAFSRNDLGQAFLRGDYAYPGDCEATDAPGAEVVIACRVAGEIRRELRVARATGLIAEETSYERGLARMILRPDDYRPVGVLWLPFHIYMVYPEKGASVDIRIQAYELNPVLDAVLFQPPTEL